MPQLLIPDVEPKILEQLRERASRHGRTIETEARTILAEALRPIGNDAWTEVDAIRKRLEATGREFSDSVPLIREDRDR
jgi:plasmid stability protein